MGSSLRCGAPDDDDDGSEGQQSRGKRGRHRSVEDVGAGIKQRDRDLTLYHASAPTAKVSESVAIFVLNFEEKFEDAPIAEKKLLVKKMISEIIVDRDKGVVKFYVRCVPMVSNEIEELYKNKREPARVASSRSSGGRT